MVGQPQVPGAAAAARRAARGADRRHRRGRGLAEGGGGLLERPLHVELQRTDKGHEAAKQSNKHGSKHKNEKGNVFKTVPLLSPFQRQV